MNMKKLALASGALAVIAAGSVANAKVVDKPKFKVGGLVLVWGGTTADADAAVVSDFYLLTGGTSTDLIGGTANDINGGASSAVVTGAFDVIATNGATNAAADGVVTEVAGGTAGVLDATDTLSAFAIDNNTDLADVAGVAKGKFFVASNTGFQIKAQATLDPASSAGMTLANVKYGMAVDATTGTSGAVGWGANSQDPCSATATCGVQASVARLSDMATEATVFTADRKTAATRGSIADQSVRFDTTYSFDSDGTAGTEDSYDLADGTFDLEAEVVYTVYAP